jgi:hypothetical protein
MGILYGAMTAFLISELARWWSMPTALVGLSPDVPPLVQWSLVIMALGVFASGARDLYAAYGLPGGTWPWTEQRGMP